MKGTQIVIAAVLGLVLAGGGFAAGMTVEKGAATASASPSGAVGRFGGAGGSGARGRFGGGAGTAAGQSVLTGRVISVNDGSITILTRQAGAQGASPAVASEIVLVGSGTRVVKTVETDVPLSELKANDQVTIVATSDSSGALSASAIVLGGNALGGLFGGGRAGGRGAGPSPSPTP